MENLKNKFNRFGKTMKNLPGYASAKIKGKPFHWTMSNLEAKGRSYNFQKAAEIRSYLQNQKVRRPEMSSHAELVPENVENLEEVNVQKVLEQVKQYPGNVRFQNNNLPLVPRPKKETFEPIGLNLTQAAPYSLNQQRENIRRNIRNGRSVRKSNLELLLNEGRQNDFQLVANYLKKLAKKGGKTRKARKAKKTRKH
jgi:hypothetical protein